MNFQEKKLYHQIHPAIIASLLIVRFVPLEKYKQSPFGRYVKIYMTKLWETIRFSGYVIAVLGGLVSYCLDHSGRYCSYPFGLGTWPDFFKTLKVKPTDLAQTTIAICSPLNR